LKWALNNPGIATAIPGMTSFDQLELNLSVVKDINLTDEEKRDLKLAPPKAAFSARAAANGLAQCPHELPIPSLMRSYMYAYGYRNLGEAYDLVASLGIEVDPCGSCDRCAVRCAQGFNIKERATDIARLRRLPSDFFA